MQRVSDYLPYNLTGVFFPRVSVLHSNQINTNFDSSVGICGYKCGIWLEWLYFLDKYAGLHAWSAEVRYSRGMLSLFSSLR